MDQVSKRPKNEAEFNGDLYWERVNRSLGWLGNTDDEQRHILEAIKDITIGLAGCGGIGGMAASRLGRRGGVDCASPPLHFPDDFRVLCRDPQQGMGSARRIPPSLFPFLQSPYRYAHERGKLRL